MAVGSTAPCCIKAKNTCEFPGNFHSLRKMLHLWDNLCARKASCSGKCGIEEGSENISQPSTPMVFSESFAKKVEGKTASF